MNLHVYSISMTFVAWHFHNLDVSGELSLLGPGSWHTSVKHSQKCHAVRPHIYEAMLSPQILWLESHPALKFKLISQIGLVISNFSCLYLHFAWSNILSKDCIWFFFFFKRLILGQWNNFKWTNRLLKQIYYQSHCPCFVKTMEKIKETVQPNKCSTK